jgi:hypothetical protein
MALLRPLSPLVSLAPLASCALVTLVTLVALPGCNDKLPPGSSLDGVRVLAVQLDPPFGRPGSPVGLTMASVDTRAPAEVSRLPVQVAWFGGCFNPVGDAPAQCIPAMEPWIAGLSPAQLAGQEPPPASLPAGLLGHGETFSITLPADLISSRPPTVDGAPAFGIAHVYFAACGGELRAIPRSASPQGFPVGCFDPSTGAALGARDLVVGSAQIRSYDALTNQNPRLTGLTVEGQLLGQQACVRDADCAAGQGCGSQRVCLPVVAACQTDKQDDCPKIHVGGVLDPATVELDDTAASYPVPETVWISYFTTSGQFADEVGLVSSPSLPLRAPADSEGTWQPAPHFTGEAALWAVARDGRGGVSWLSHGALVR